MSELKPCPFCGNKNPRVVHHFVNGIANLSHCFVRCNCGRGKTTASRKEEHGAIDEWNTRPIEDELNAEIARRDEIIKRLKEDAIILALMLTLNGKFKDSELKNFHSVINSHIALMKELE